MKQRIGEKVGHSAGPAAEDDVRGYPHLTYHDFTDLLPGTLYLAVPPRFQKKPPRSCTVHKQRPSKADLEELEGFRVTTPLRTLLEAGESHDVSQHELTKATRVALERGLVRRTVLVQVAPHSPAQKRLARALERAQRTST